MKLYKYLSCIIFIFFFIRNNTYAQYVSIPDTNFGTWLYNNGFNNCLTGNNNNGWQLDTTCTTVLTASSIICEGDSLHSIEGVQYFKNLGYLDCYYNQISSLPNLPPHLTVLYCDNNNLTSLPLLPMPLCTLWCNYNNLTALPPIPPNITLLQCGNNHITTIPPLSNIIVEFRCNGNNIDSLPILPDSITTLDIAYNNITNIHNIPKNLTAISVAYNHLTSLPPLINSQLFHMDLQYNQLQSLPELPPTLNVINCQHNNLTYFPYIPLNLQLVDVSYNYNFTCFTNMPAYMQILGFDSTQVSCMPSRFSCQGFSPTNPDSMPLCTVNSGCPFYYNITGTIFNDTNQICPSNSAFLGYSFNGLKVMLYDSNAGLIQQYITYGLNYGMYSFKTNQIAKYYVSIDTSDTPFRIVCPPNGYEYISESDTDSVFVNKNFGLMCKGVDNGVTGIYCSSFRPGWEYPLFILAGDLSQPYGINCANHSSGQIKVILNGPIRYDSAYIYSRTPSSIIGNTITYNIADFDSITFTDFSLFVSTDTNATIGSIVSVEVIVNTDNNLDINKNNDTLIQFFTVINSFDPNRKTVSPLSGIRVGDWINYTIEFQNTGTDTAYTVVIKDTLDSDLDLSTFVFLGSDHHASINIEANIITFTFPKINLPDSFHNQTKSHGWLQYKIKTKSNLIPNTSISNKAFIYFDFNPAIVTNTAVSNISTGINTIPEQNTSVQIAPNPNKGQFIVYGYSSDSKEIEVYNMLGQRVMQKNITSSDIEKIKLDADPGVYFLVIKGTKHIQQIKFVID